MLKNYFRVAYRNLKRNQGYALINLTGLAIGVAVCLLIALYVQHQLSYDEFHKKAERIHRIVRASTEGNRTELGTTMPSNMGPLLEKELSGVTKAVRFRSIDDMLISRPDISKNVASHESQFVFVDSTFSEVFSFELLKGNPATALDAPYSVVLTKLMAEKYFPNGNPLGKILTYSSGGEKHSFTVTGVIEEPPANSSIQFNFLAPFSTLRDLEPWYLGSWSIAAYRTYLLLAPGTSPDTFEDRLTFSLKRSTDSGIILESEFRVQPLTEVYFSEAGAGLGPSGDIRYVYIFSSIGFLILLVVAANYVNLATARSVQRSKEVGIRKTLGAHRMQVARQVFGESVILSLLALPLALGLAWLAMPFLGELLPFGAGTLYDAPFLLIVIGIVLAVGLLSGGYPATVLSRFQPAEVLRGGGQVAQGSATIRKGLVVFQFGVAVGLVACTFVIWHQLNYVGAKRLGLDEERVVVLPTRSSSVEGSRATALKHELAQLTEVSSVSVSSGVPTRTLPTLTVEASGIEGELDVSILNVDGDFLETFGVELKAGRGITAGMVPADSNKALLLNETAVQKLGWKNPVGKTLTYGGREGRVIGVVNDFHFASMREEIGPMILMPRAEGASYVSAKVQSGNLSATLEAIERSWNKFAPNHPASYFFLDTAFDQLYRSEERLAQLFSIFALFALFIACLGLFGLATYAAEQRTKEIGIRKAFGASVPSIVALLSKDFLKPLGVAFIIAAPLAFYVMQRWLDGFAYRIDPSPWTYLLAGAVVFTVALLAVSYQAGKAALANPVESLRHE